MAFENSEFHNNGELRDPVVVTKHRSAVEIRALKSSARFPAFNASLGGEQKEYGSHCASRQSVSLY